MGVWRELGVENRMSKPERNAGDAKILRSNGQ
jgi:hypothetical protein